MKFVIFAFLISLACAFATPIEDSQSIQTIPTQQCDGKQLLFKIYTGFKNNAGMSLEEIQFQ